eukprot:g23755.t1
MCVPYPTSAQLSSASSFPPRSPPFPASTTSEEALGPTKNVAILGDFNTPSQRTATLTEEHRRQAELLDHLSQQRDPKALRHFLPRDSPRIPEDPGTGSTLSASLRQGNSGDLSTFPGSH